MSHSNNRDKIIMAAAMLIFGSMGIFISNITFPSSVISLIRAFIGSLLIGIYAVVSRRRFDKTAILKNLKLLVPSGIIMAFNWICLFEAYKHTGVAVATLCYYMAPVIVVLASPIFLKERLTAVKGVSVAVAVVGAVLISGAVNGAAVNLKGILLGLAAAGLYGSIVIINKFVKGLSPIETTFVQLLTAGISMIPYVLLTEDIGSIDFNGKAVALMLIVGAVHTGIVYVMYFASMQKISAQTTAVFSYIDPVTAIIFSSLFLKERLDAIQTTGTVLILSATLFNELAPIIFKRKCGE